MQLVEPIFEFIEQPFPVWENELTEMLVKKKWKELIDSGLYNEHDYSTAKIILNTNVPKPRKVPLTKSHKEVVSLEAPSFDILQSFYEEHGLEPLSEGELELNTAIPKLKSAINIIELVTPAFLSVTKLVRSIQVLRQEDNEIDISYSHPKIPFSIFVTVCQDDSVVSSLRVAESILHESMHLKLTLIEDVLPLVKQKPIELFYSPWRNEERPIRGVLHGLFVFRAIYDYYSTIIKNAKNETYNFLSHRLADIRFEINTLKKFPEVRDLTDQGKKLAYNLIDFKETAEYNQLHLTKILK